MDCNLLQKYLRERKTVLASGMAQSVKKRLIEHDIPRRLATGDELEKLLEYVDRRNALLLQFSLSHDAQLLTRQLTILYHSFPQND